MPLPDYQTFMRHLLPMTLSRIKNCTLAISLTFFLNCSVSASIFSLAPYGSEGVTSSIGKNIMLVSIKGTITDFTLAHFWGVISKDVEYKQLIVDLDSEGGDLNAAMKIGRIIREYDGHTRMGLGKKCYSSCALIFIAGVQRDSWGGVIGLHRPYLASLPQTPDNIEKHFREIIVSMKTYINEMKITDEFYQKMMNTAPSAMFTLTGDKLELLVPNKDFIFDEIQTAQAARKYGVTTNEIRKRHINSRICFEELFNSPAPKSPTNCIEAVYWDITIHRYNDRKDSVLNQCALTPEETELIRSTPRKRRWEHPITTKQESCIRNGFTSQ